MNIEKEKKFMMIIQGRNSETNEIVAIKKMSTGRKQNTEVCSNNKTPFFLNCNLFSLNRLGKIF